MKTSTPANKTTSNAVSKEIICYCTRCKMDLGHTIMAMVGGMPARVMCRTCKSEHNYKAKKGLKEPGTSTPREPRVAREPKEKVVPVELEWMQQMNASTKPLRVYAADEPFQAGDRVSHPIFGEGVVQ